MHSLWPWTTPPQEGLSHETVRNLHLARYLQDVFVSTSRLAIAARVMYDWSILVRLPEINDVKIIEVCSWYAMQ